MSFATVPNHPNVARDLNNLALLLRATNRVKEAEPAMRRVIDIFEKRLGPEHQNVATTLNNLADLLRETERYEEAETLYRRALKIDEHNFGLDHHTIARDFNNLSLAAENNGAQQRGRALCASRAGNTGTPNWPTIIPGCSAPGVIWWPLKSIWKARHDKISFEPTTTQFDLAVLGGQAHQAEGTTLWDLFDDEVEKRKRDRSPLSTKILGKLLGKKD